jgi:invasion protein IalB
MALSLLTLALAGSLGAGTALAKQPPDAAKGAGLKARLLPASARLAAEPVAATPAASLPNGASSINETYGNWVVTCQLLGGKKQCLVFHAQSDNQTAGSRSQFISKRQARGNTRGMILMPFGLNLAAGAILTIDDKELEDGLRFSTCVPEGCVLPMSFAAEMVEAMKKSNVLTVASVALGSGEMVVFKVPLEGFPAAIARVGELRR